MSLETRRNSEAVALFMPSMWFLFAMTLQGAECPVTDLRTAGVERPAGYGRIVVGMGDVDGDEVADYTVADMSDDWPRVDRVLYGHSGRTGAVLFEWHGSVTGIRSIADFDGDRGRDLIVRSDKEARVISGRTGAPINALAILTADRPITNVDVVGDVDQDGRADFLVVGRERLVILSGATGGVLGERALRDPSLSTCGSAEARVVGDVDGNGIANIALPGRRLADARSGEDPVESVQERLVLLDASTLVSVRTIVDTSIPSRFRRSFEGVFGPAGDDDHDGVPDLFSFGAETITIHSGRSGLAIRSFPVSGDPRGRGPTEGRFALLPGANDDAPFDVIVPRAIAPRIVEFFPEESHGAMWVDGASGMDVHLFRCHENASVESLANIGDIDGDQRDDLAIATMEHPTGGDAEGVVWIVSGATRLVLRRQVRPVAAIRPLKR